MGKNYEVVITQEFDSLDEAIIKADEYGKSWDNVKVCAKNGKYLSPIWEKTTMLEDGCCSFEAFRCYILQIWANDGKDCYIQNAYTQYSYFDNPADIEIDYDKIVFVAKPDNKDNCEHRFIVDKFVDIETSTHRYTRNRFTISQLGRVLFSLRFE